MNFLTLNLSVLYHRRWFLCNPTTSKRNRLKRCACFICDRGPITTGCLTTLRRSLSYCHKWNSGRRRVVMAIRPRCWCPGNKVEEVLLLFMYLFYLVKDALHHGVCAQNLRHDVACFSSEQYIISLSENNKCIYL